MLTLEPELLQLRDSGSLRGDDAERLIAIERRELFSLHGELRATSYVSVLLLITGLGILLKNNFDRLGPIAIILLILLASAACYAYVIRKHVAKRARTIVDDYVLLLAALLLSTAIGYAENQFHLLGTNWQRHFLLLAIIHGVTAYWLDSRLVLSAALTALAAWLGFEHRGALFDGGAEESGGRGLLFTAIVLAIRYANMRSRHGRTAFDIVYAQAAALAGFFSALIWVGSSRMRWFGVLAVAALDALFLGEAIRMRREILIAYSIIASVIAVDIISFEGGDLLGPLVALTTAVGAIVALFVIHARFEATR
jgi:hypothetical protein